MSENSCLNRENSGCLYMIPSPMSDAPFSNVFPAYNLEVIGRLRHFIVENVRSARRFIKKCNPAADISSLTFFELNRFTDSREVGKFLEPLRNGHSMGMISDAGCPGVADPGALPVAMAQREGYRVEPLVGPSSILLALMASGFNGQGFSFQGYLPIDDSARAESLRKLERDSRRNDMTEIFIETPYRNEKMMDFLLQHLEGPTLVSVSCDLTSPGHSTSITRTCREWKNMQADAATRMNFNKRPAIFLIYAGSEHSLHLGKTGKR